MPWNACFRVSSTTPLIPPRHSDISCWSENLIEESFGERNVKSLSEPPPNAEHTSRSHARRLRLLRIHDGRHERAPGGRGRVSRTQGNRGHGHQAAIGS